MKRAVSFFCFAIFIFSSSVAQDIHAIHPSFHLLGKTFPIAIEAKSDGNLDRFHSSEINATVSQVPSSTEIIKVKKGRGLVGVVSNQPGNLQLTAPQLNIVVPENTDLPVYHSGTLTGAEVWPSGSIHIISLNYEIASGASLSIEEGCWVLLDSAVNITANGSVNALGTKDNPIAFGSNSTSFNWGGVAVDQGIATFEYCLFTHGGGDNSQAFGHSGSQATLKSNGGVLELTRSFIFDCAGKGIGAQNGFVTFTNGAISRCDMGGEFLGSSVQVSGSHILDIPNDDGLFLDDDNDGFYFGGTSSQTSNPSVLDSCVFMFGKDDAIDHNGAILEVRNSWVEGFENEGIAASNENSVFIYNSMFKNCEQGIEAGYGSPQVTVDHCLMLENENGLRFGDWYDWGCTGSITCTNSIISNNDDNVYNYDLLTEAPVIDAINLTYSITNDFEYDNGFGCITGTPNFSAHYLLENGSPGIGIANDGSNMGLVSSLSTGVKEPPSFNHPLTAVSIYGIDGRLVYHQVTAIYDPTTILQLNAGIYIVEKTYGVYKSNNKQVVVR